MEVKVKWLAVCGMIGPVAYTLVVFTLGMAYPGYDHVRDFMSELGATGAPTQTLMNVFGFYLLGVLIIAFSYAVYKAFGSKPAAALIAVGGAGIILAGVFHCDVDCGGGSLENQLHGISAVVPGVAIPIAAILLYFAMEGDTGRAALAKMSLVVGLTTAALGIFFLLAEVSWVGLLQRAVMGIPMLWMEILAISIYRSGISE